MSEFVKELPAAPIEGCTVWVSLGPEGHWAKQLFAHGKWHWVGGMAVPYTGKAHSNTSSVIITLCRFRTTWNVSYGEEE